MQDDFFRFMHAEQKYIDDAKWYEGIRINRDPGDAFVMQWALQHAKEFRDMWDKSNCKNCCLCSACGNNVIEDCDNFSMHS